MKTFSQYSDEAMILEKIVQLQRSLNIDRKELPQIRSMYVPEFLTFMSHHQVTHHTETVKAKKLRPIQASIETDRLNMLKPNDSAIKPLIVSSDNYILDGHHRWYQATLADEDLHIIRLNVPMKRLLDLAKTFPNVEYQSVKLVAEETLQEKLIVVNNGKKYGQIIFLVGGGGSGKGFAINKFVDSTSFVVRDVDAMKMQLLKMDEFLHHVKMLPDCADGEKFEAGKSLHCNPYKSIRGLDLRNPQHTLELHMMVDKLGLKDTTLRNILAAALSANKGREESILPNIIFDITGKNISSITSAIHQLTAVGYKATNVHLIWVLANYEVAVNRNAKRSRMVPADVLLDTHEGAAITMHGILSTGAPHGLDGSIYVILNRDLVQHDTTDPHTGVVTKSDYYADGKTVRNFDYVKVKASGETVNIEAERERLQGWILANIPRSNRTGAIITNTLQRQ